MNSDAIASAPFATRRVVAGAAITLIVALFGLYLVKWSPYYAKAFAAAAHHSLGTSIVSGTAAAPPAAGWTAAWTYARAYFLAIWQALLLALLLGACIQVLLPTRWISEQLGSLGGRSTAVAGVLTMAGMMCTCCTAPVIVGLRKQRAAPGTAMAIFVGTPTLNPAVLLFIGFVLSWQFAALRLIVGLALVVAVAWIASRQRDAAEIPAGALPAAPIEDPGASAAGVVRAWLRVVWWELYTILPGYIAIVFLLGAVRAWLFHPGMLEGTNGIVAAVVAAVVGTLFVIPTGGEVPIVQTLAHFGLGTGAAAALLIALPAISLPSVYIVRGAFTPRVLAGALGAVGLAGLLAGIAAHALHLAPG